MASVWSNAWRRFFGLEAKPSPRRRRHGHPTPIGDREVAEVLTEASEFAATGRTYRLGNAATEDTPDTHSKSEAV
jgi:hypothetical protein